MNLNIKTRLTIQFTVIVAGILTLFSIIIYYFSATYREWEFYTRLENKAYNTARLLINVKEIDNKLLKIIDKNTINALYDEKVVIYNFKDSLIYSSIDDDSLSISKTQIDKVRLNKEIRFNNLQNEVIGILYTDRYDRFVVFASAYDKYGKSKLKNLKWVLLFGLFGSIVVTAFAGRFYAIKALQPIKEVVSQAEKINISSMNLRLEEGNGTDEIAQLAITFNKMLSRLQESFEMQKSFVSNASHELRTPLTSITGQLEVSLLKKRTQEEYETILKSILEDINTLSDLSNGLLDLAKASSDPSSVKFEKIRLDDLVWQVSEYLKQKRNYNLIEITFDPTIEDEEYLTVYGNEHLIKTAILNIIDNACKYSNGMKVSVTLKSDKKNIFISVVDKGIGIDKEDLQKIFEPFFRAKNARLIQGNGLGLSLTNKIISLHGGVLDISSVIGKGTTVTIQLPCAN